MCGYKVNMVAMKEKSTVLLESNNNWEKTKNLQGKKLLMFQIK